MAFLPVTSLHFLTSHRLENVCEEMVAEVVSAWCWVIVVPLLVVNRDSHLGWITVVEAVGTSIVLIAPIVLRVGHVRVMIEPIHVPRALLTPIGTVGGLMRLLGLCG